MGSKINIDKILNENKEFWQDLETYCVAECCGIDAFNIGKDHLLLTIKHYELQTIMNHLRRVIEIVDKSEKENVQSYLFNHIESKKEFKDRMNTILNIVKNK